MFAFVIQVRRLDTGEETGYPRIVLSEMQSPYKVMVAWAKRPDVGIVLFPPADAKKWPGTYLVASVEGSADRGPRIPTLKVTAHRVPILVVS